CDGMFAWFGSRHRRRQVRDLREQRLVHEMAVEQEPDPDDERTDDGKVDRLLYASTTVMVFITLLRNNLVGPGNNYGNEKSQAQDEQENRQGPVRQLQRADHHLRNLQQQPRDRGIRDGDADYVTLLQFLATGSATLRASALRQSAPGRVRRGRERLHRRGDSRVWERSGCTAGC